MSTVEQGEGQVQGQGQRLRDALFELWGGLELGVLMVDPDGAIQESNLVAANLLECSPASLIGRSLSSFVLVDVAAVGPPVIDETLELGAWSGELVLPRSFGRMDVVSARSVLVTEDDPGLIKMVLILVEPAGGAESRRFPLPSSLSELVSDEAKWEWDPRTDELWLSRAFAFYLGLPADVGPPMASALDAVFAEDRTRAGTEIADAVFGQADSFKTRFRALGADGTSRWLEVSAEVLRTSDGSASRVCGTMQNITESVRADEQVRRTDRFWQATIDSLTAEVAVLNDRGEIIAVNEAWRRFARSIGASSDPVGLNYPGTYETASDERTVRVAAGIRGVLTGVVECFECEYPRGDFPHDRWFLMRATRHVGNSEARTVVTHQDVTEHRQERDRALLQAAVLHEIDVAVIATAIDQTITSWNAAAEQLYGYSEDEAIGCRLDELLSPAEGSAVEAIKARTNGGRCDRECILRRGDGSLFPAYVRTCIVTDSEGRETAAVGVSMDISQQRQSRRELKLARDYLRAVTDSMAEGMYTLDVDGRVTYMNQAAEAQLGWSFDELQDRVMHECSHNRRADGSRMPIEECEIRRARSEGEVVRVEDDLFVRRDGTAMPVSYTAAPFATEDGVEGCVVVFEDITERKTRERQVEADLDKLAWVKRIGRALSEDRFVLHAQPIIELATGEVIQQELLIRMQDDDSTDSPGNLIAPGRFLPVAEEYGFITEIDRWVIGRAAEIAATGQPVELNVSAASIGDTTLAIHIDRAIRRAGADPTTMVFEITETALVEDETAARNFVIQLHALGCKVALDDFGTGYGGFTYLKQLPIDSLKIDIEFVRDLPHTQASRHVVEAIVSLARNFHLKTVAEGVEDQTTLDLLRQLGVDYAQGYHVGRPAPLPPRHGNWKRAHHV